MMSTTAHIQTLQAHDAAVEAEYAALTPEEKLKREQEFRDSLKGLTPAELRAKKAELIRRKNRRDENVKYMNGLVQGLRNLSEGKLQDRFLYALRTASPELYRKSYPRRYRDIDTHYSPRYLLVMAEFIRVAHLAHAQKQDCGEFRGCVTDQLLQDGVPTYWLSRQDAASLLETDCEDVMLSMADFDWPHQAFMVMPPRECFPGSPVLCTFNRQHDGARFGSIDPKHGFAEYTVELQDVIGVEYKKAIQDPAWQSRDLTWLKFVINILLAMVAEPTYTRSEVVVKSGGNTGRGKPAPPGLWNPNFLDFHQQEVQEIKPAGETHEQQSSVRPHTRRGHWRTRWLLGKPEAEILVGQRVIWLQDQRRAMFVTALDGPVATVRNAHGQHSEVPLDDLRPAASDLKWIRKLVIGLKNRMISHSKEIQPKEVNR